MQLYGESIGRSVDVFAAIACWRFRFALRSQMIARFLLR